jgi:hypothetical protein
MMVMTGSEADALFTHLREVLDRLVRIEEKLEHASDHADRIGKIELKQANQDGAIGILKWAIPGGPALVTLIGGIALWLKAG